MMASGEGEEVAVAAVEQMSVSENGPSVSAEPEEDEVTPWDVSSKSASGVDYDKLIRE